MDRGGRGAHHDLAGAGPGDFTPEPVPERHADHEYLREAMASDTVVVCNALSAESFEEGSIEGSTNLHATSLFDDGEIPHFRADEVLTELLEDAGYEEGHEFLSFCGPGYTASINHLAARLLGIEQVRMNDGSLIDWNARGGSLLPAGGRSSRSRAAGPHRRTGRCERRLLAPTAAAGVG